MKLNLIFGSNGIRSGYHNIDPFPNGVDGTQRGDVANLDWAVSDAECMEIIAIDIIDFVPRTEQHNVLSHWIKKLRHGGIITVGGIDLLLLSKAIVSREVGVSDAAELIYGDQDLPWKYRKNAQCLSMMSQFFADSGLKITQRRMKGFFYVVTGERP